MCLILQFQKASNIFLPRLHLHLFASLVTLDEVDKTVGGGVVGRDRRVVRQLGLDGLGQLLSELNTEQKHKQKNIIK